MIFRLRSIQAKLLLPTLLIALSTNIFAQATFQEVIGTSFIFDYEGSVSFADIDGDNDQDLLITGTDGAQWLSKLYTNDGNGNFTLVVGTPFDAVFSSASKFVDVDGDNDQDLFIAGLSGSQRITKLYINNGGGIFTLATGTSFVGVDKVSIASADIDGDNDIDIFIMGHTGSQAISKLYINDGNGVFTLVTGTSLVDAYGGDVAFADIDGDNDQDILITGGGNTSQRTSKLYVNDGIGNFTLVTGTPFDDVNSSSIAFADVDGDNDQDVLITGSTTSQITKLYLNNGNGIFYLDSGTPFDPVTVGSVKFADIDNDNDVDLLITGRSGSSQIAKLYVNDGSGVFTLVTGTPFDGIQYGDVAFVDIDGDNDQDVLISGEGFQNITKLYENICHVKRANTTDTICLGSNYIFPDNYTATIFSDTSHISTLQGVLGCDSIITSDIYILRIANATVDYVCDTTSLYVTGDLTSYTWSGSVQNGVSFTPPDGVSTYYVSGVTTQGCSVQDSITINKAEPSYKAVIVNGTPQGNPGDLCEGTQVTLGANYNATASWGNVTWGAGTPTGTFIPAPNSSYYFTVTHPFGCIDTAKFTLAIYPLPTVGYIATPSTIVCEGDQVNLTGTGISPVNSSTYLWYQGATNVSTYYYDFTATTSANYIVVGTDVNGCSRSTTVQITVNLNPIVTIGSFVQDPICLKDNPVTLPVGMPSGGTYSGSGVVSNSTFNPNWSGGIGFHAINYMYTDGNGCKADATKMIEVIGSPSFSYQTNGNSVTLNSSMSCANYYWNFGDGNTNSLTLNPAYTYTVDGTYSVCLVCDDIVQCVSCVNLTFPSNVSGSIDGVVGVDEIDKEDGFSVYPNPSTGKFNLIYDTELRGKEVRIYTISGQLIDTVVLNTHNNSVMIDISGIENGIYFLKLQGDKSTIVKKIIKQ